MLNWISSMERLPNQSDSDYRTEKVYAIAGSVIYAVHYSAVTPEACSHWIPLKEIPLPKRWRVPTIHDLAKAGKPIPCRVRMSVKDYWVDRNLIAISVEQNKPMPFATSDEKWWQGCEICDE